MKKCKYKMNDRYLDVQQWEMFTIVKVNPAHQIIVIRYDDLSEYILYYFHEFKQLKDKKEFVKINMKRMM